MRNSGRLRSTLRSIPSSLLLSKGTLDDTLLGGGGRDRRERSSSSFLVAVTNPKGYLFFSAFLPQFIAPNAPQTSQFVALATVFATIDFTVMFIYAALGSQAMRALRKSGALWLDRVCGGALLALAGLAFYRRASA